MFQAFGNSSILPPVNWQSEPTTRGTWNVLSSSIMTLGLCLWTALHLNIPEYGRESNQKWLKVGWLVLGLLAPEMVVYTAWAQQRAAVRLTKAMKIHLREKLQPPSYSWSYNNWINVHFGRQGHRRTVKSMIRICLKGMTQSGSTPGPWSTASTQ